MKEKADFIGILETVTRRLLSGGRFFPVDARCGILEKKDVEICPRAIFDVPLSGEKRVRICRGGEVREEILRPGDILYTPAGSWKCTKWDLPHELFCFVIDRNYLRYTYVDYRTVNADFHRPLCLDFFHTRQKPPALLPEQLRLLTECCAELPRNDAAAGLMARTILELGLEALRRDTPPPSVGKAKQTFQRLMQYLRENYMNDISRRDAARYFHLSECYVSRLFQDQCGKRFSDVLRDLRMNHAAYLLSRTGLTVAEIAEQCGYASLQTFTTVFRHYSGMPPVRYRLAQDGARSPSADD